MESLAQIGWTWAQIERGLTEIKRAQFAGTKPRRVFFDPELDKLYCSTPFMIAKENMKENIARDAKNRATEEAERKAKEELRTRNIEDAAENTARDARIKAENAAQK